jgi:hypothetical protein
MFGCKEGGFPLKYLGIPIHYSNANWKRVEERYEKRLSN